MAFALFLAGLLGIVSLVNAVQKQWFLAKLMGMLGLAMVVVAILI